MHVWIDQDLCTGDGLCTDHCPELFVLLEDGISYVHLGDLIGNDPGGASSTIPIPAQHEANAIAAARKKTPSTPAHGNTSPMPKGPRVWPARMAEP